MSEHHAEYLERTASFHRATPQYSTAWMHAQACENGAREIRRLAKLNADLLTAALQLKDVCNRPSAARTRSEAWGRLDKAIAKATGAAA